MRIRLIRKLAGCLNGVDISQFRVGDEVDLPDRSANLLIIEEWAEPVGKASQTTVKRSSGLPRFQTE